MNVGALSPVAFGAAKPSGLETWHCTATKARVELTKSDYFKRETFVFPSEAFLVDGALPTPAL